LNSANYRPSESTTPLLSILTPAFNAAAFLPALAASIAAIDADIRLEWIVVDDGSTDDSVNVFSTLAATQPTWRLVSQKNSGVAAARNRALEESRGDYVWYVDADDLVIAPAVRDLSDAVGDCPDLLAFQAERIFDHHPSELVFRRAKATKVLSGENWVVQLARQREWKHFLWQYWYRRELLSKNKIRFEVGIVHEDIAVVTEAALRASTVRYVDRSAYRYRANPNSLTSSPDARRLLSRVESYFVVIEQLRQLNQSIELGPEANSLLQGEIIGQALQVFEIAKALGDDEREHIKRECRRRAFAQGLFKHVTNFKRFRQACSLWAKQQGIWPIGRERGRHV
jgi:heptose III glucuronosyltransferase